MHTKNFQMNLEFSYQLLILLFCIHIGAIICTLLATILLLLKLMGVIIILSHFIWVSWQFIWRKGHHSICGIKVDSEGQWQIRYQGDHFIDVHLKSYLISSHFLILNFTYPKKRFMQFINAMGTIILFSDHGTAHNLRQLRILLNLNKPHLKLYLDSKHSCLP